MDERQKRHSLLARGAVRHRIGDAGERNRGRIECQALAHTRDRVVLDLGGGTEHAHRPRAIARPLFARQVAHRNHRRSDDSLLLQPGGVLSPSAGGTAGRCAHSAALAANSGVDCRSSSAAEIASWKAEAGRGGASCSLKPLHVPVLRFRRHVLLADSRPAIGQPHFHLRVVFGNEEIARMDRHEGSIAQIGVLAVRPEARCRLEEQLRDALTHIFRPFKRKVSQPFVETRAARWPFLQALKRGLAARLTLKIARPKTSGTGVTSCDHRWQSMASSSGHPRNGAAAWRDAGQCDRMRSTATRR